MPGSTTNARKGLCALLWRILVFGPIVWAVGSILLVLVMSAFVAPPIYAALAFFTGDWLLGIAALIPWFVVLRFRRPILRWTLEGIEYASL